jgi:hypothetical protein
MANVRKPPVRDWQVAVFYVLFDVHQPERMFNHRECAPVSLNGYTGEVIEINGLSINHAVLYAIGDTSAG